MSWAGTVFLGTVIATVAYAIFRKSTLQNEDVPHTPNPQWDSEGVVFVRNETDQQRSAYEEWIWSNRKALFDKYSLLLGARLRPRRADYYLRGGIIRGLTFERNGIILKVTAFEYVAKYELWHMNRDRGWSHEIAELQVRYGHATPAFF